MKSTKPTLLAILLAGSLCFVSSAFAADAGVSTSTGVTTGAGSAGVNSNSTVTTPDANLPATPMDPADRMDRNQDSRTKSTTNRNTNMRNKDCDVNVSSNSPTKNCDDTNKPKK